MQFIKIIKTILLPLTGISTGILLECLVKTDNLRLLLPIITLIIFAILIIVDKHQK
jgi:hypothetical protein